MKRGYILATAVPVMLFVGCSRNQEQARGPAADTGQSVQAPAPGAQPPAAGQNPNQVPGGQPLQPLVGGQQAPAPAQRRTEAARTEKRTAEQRPSATKRSDSPPTAPLAPAVPPAPRIFTVPAGTKVSVRTTNTITTKTAKDGEPFTATLNEPITVDGKVLAERGAEVQGVVLRSDPGGRVKGVANVAVALKSVKLANGRNMAISTTNVEETAKSSKKKDAMKVGIGAGIGAAIGAIAGGGKGAAIGAGAGGAAGTGAVLATRGDPAVIPSESVLVFTLKAPVEVTEK